MFTLANNQLQGKLALKLWTHTHFPQKWKIQKSCYTI